MGGKSAAVVGFEGVDKIIMRFPFKSGLLLPFLRSFVFPPFPVSGCGRRLVEMTGGCEAS